MKATPLKVLLEHRKILRQTDCDLQEIDYLIAEMVKAVDYRIGLYTVHSEGAQYTIDQKIKEYLK